MPEPCTSGKCHDSHDHSRYKCIPCKCEERKRWWSAAEVSNIAAEVALDIDGFTWNEMNAALSGIECGPDGITRTQVAEALRMLLTIPPDDGRPRE